MNLLKLQLRLIYIIKRKKFVCLCVRLIEKSSTRRNLNIWMRIVKADLNAPAAKIFHFVMISKDIT